MFVEVAGNPCGLAVSMCNSYHLLAEVKPSHKFVQFGTPHLPQSAVGSGFSCKKRDEVKSNSWCTFSPEKTTDIAQPKNKPTFITRNNVVSVFPWPQPRSFCFKRRSRASFVT